MKKAYAATSIEALRHVLGDTYVLAVKTQNAHWNLEGESFIGLHLLLERQYKELVTAIDVVSERIRALGDVSPGDMATFIALARLQEEKSLVDPRESILKLADDHTRLSTLLEEHIAILEPDNDYGTIDLFTDRIRDHDHEAWLLRAHYP
tara:strand:+ start:313 stop:762 length:450 start_codon:yes stop_codon:yes gene_type:complete